MFPYNYIFLQEKVYTCEKAYVPIWDKFSIFLQNYVPTLTYVFHTESACTVLQKLEDNSSWKIVYLVSNYLDRYWFSYLYAQFYENLLLGSRISRL